jgi:hypothetical protein
MWVPKRASKHRQNIKGYQNRSKGHQKKQNHPQQPTNICYIYIYTTSAMILLLKPTSMYGDFTAIQV